MRAYLFLCFFLPVNCIMPLHAQQGSDSLVYKDAANGLMWMKADFSAINRRFVSNWQECFTWQQEINAAAYAGYSDWQVPTIAQYRSINRNKTDRQRYHSIFTEMDTTCVWGKGPYSFWASNQRGPYVASYISFIDGFATSGNKEKQIAGGEWEGIPFGFSVRLVRKAAR